MNKKYLIIITILTIIILTFISCSPKILGYGTVIWSSNENIFPTGQTITVISESDLADVYLISNGKDTESIQIERWRIQLFDELTDAEEKSKTVSEFKTIFARNLKDGLLIRSDPDIGSERVYKMRKHQIIKVFGRTSDLASVGQYEGYWYQVITEDGTIGYCFDQNLYLYDSSISPEEQEDPSEILIKSAFNKIYRPSSFIDMIKNNAINLENFKSQIGLFPNLETNNLKIITSAHTLDIKWDYLTLVDKRSFSLGDTDIIVHVLSDTKLQISYYYEDQKFITNYYVIKGLEEIILAEIERRESLYDSLLGIGTNFASNAYGNIRFQMDGSFIWRDYDRLVPQIIEEGSNGTGRVRFNKFISSELSDEFSGIISFYFKYKDKEIPVNFLYILIDDKFRITYVPEIDINTQLIVSKKSKSPVVLAFSAN
jgi:hypothetical protein